MKAIFKMGLITLIAASMITACSSSKTGSEKAAPTASEKATAPAAASATALATVAPSKEKVKLKFWTNARHDADLMQASIKTFNETNKSGIEVDYQIMTDNYEQALQTAIQANEAPDIFNAKSKLAFETMLKMKAIEPLDAYLTPEIKTRFGENLLKLDRQNYADGKTYSLPNYGTTWRLIYNKDLFAKAGLTAPPKSLDELAAYAQKITAAGKADGVYGFALNMKSPPAAFERGLLPMVRLDGKDIYDWKAGKYTFESVKPYAETIKKIVDSKSMLPGYETLDIDPLRNQFAAGKIGMYFSLSGEPGVYTTQFPTKINWAVAQVPTADGQPGKGANYINGAASWLYMSASSKHKAETWELMNYLYSDDVLVPYYEQGKGVSVVPSVISKAKEPALINFKDFAPKADAIWPPYMALKVEGKVWQDEIAQYILNGITLDKAIEDLNKRYNASLDKEETDGKIKRIVIPSFDATALVKK